MHSEEVEIEYKILEWKAATNRAQSQKESPNMRHGRKQTRQERCAPSISTSRPTKAPNKKMSEVVMEHRLMICIVDEVDQ